MLVGLQVKAAQASAAEAVSTAEGKEAECAALRRQLAEAEGKLAFAGGRGSADWDLSPGAPGLPAGMAAAGAVCTHRRVRAGW